MGISGVTELAKLATSPAEGMAHDGIDDLDLDFGDGMSGQWVMVIHVI